MVKFEEAWNTPPHFLLGVRPVTAPGVAAALVLLVLKMPLLALCMAALAISLGRVLYKRDPFIVERLESAWQLVAWYDIERPSDVR